MLFECVPNFSEGCDEATADALAAAARGAGARVLHRTSDTDHNRTVITLAGEGAALEAAALAMARVAVDRIDLRRHRGVHPRIGALDVLPFVPLRGATMEDAVALARSTARRIWNELRVPAYLYEEAALRPERRDLARVRNVGFEALAARMLEPAGAPDVGDPVPHPSAGAVAVGARALLVAWNAVAEGIGLGAARAIARRMRERDGGLRTLKALAFPLAGGRVQLSFNLTDVAATPLHRVTELARREISRAGGALIGTELVGLVPLEAVVAAASYYGGIADMAADDVYL
ncbi:MAG TPA: glutamate formimidoyltransferase [Candidatus Dormibacteraeota bacterium]|nr:glutamate formimidoyltransferase [Candidatus Dormibacteraeota bacterium]